MEPAIEQQQTQWSMSVSLFWEQDFVSIKERRHRAFWKSAGCINSLSITSVTQGPDDDYLAQDAPLKLICVVVASVYPR